MITSMLACGKASVSGAHKAPKAIPSLQSCRPYSGPSVGLSNGHGHGNGGIKPIRLTEDPATQRELFMNVLQANATKRDAKQYLARFKPAKPFPGHAAAPSKAGSERGERQRLQQIGVNLGGLYAPAWAIADSPQFPQQDVQDAADVFTQKLLHVALVSLRMPETLDEEVLEGIAVTLSQLVKLDMRILLVVDTGYPAHLGQGHGDDLPSPKAFRTLLAEQAERLSKILARHGPEGARFVPGALEVSDSALQDKAALGRVSVGVPQLLLEPLKRSVIPVVPTLAYTASGQLTHVTATETMTALTALLAGYDRLTSHAVNNGESPQRPTLLDRIILLDPAGGIPSKDRGDDAHVFINLEQEYNHIQRELSMFTRDASRILRRRVLAQHRQNLDIAQQCLAMLPSSSSALIITPEEAASYTRSPTSTSQTPVGTGTRKQKNTLIHNLLTNKPIVSPSLPIGRLSPAISPSDAHQERMKVPSATLLKRGMPLTIVPAVFRGQGWQRPSSGKTTLDLESDLRIDLPRLVHLVNDSFRRKLDVKGYLTRIRGSVAGLIIAGEYEGAAILTWERPPGTSDPSHLVPYLDKFAVLQSSQGSAGVADILFQAMVRSCFPGGACWRSRSNNPVNKWYFERAVGTWRVPGTQWSMFWTGEGVVEDEGRWKDYVGVCESVVPTWADDRAPD